MKYYIANWKMNMTGEDISVWIRSFKGEKDQTIIIAPSLPHLNLVKDAGFVTCAQDISLFEKGAHTGENGAFQIKDYCKYCIIGHSEKQEDGQTVIKKRDLCLKEGIIPILCFVDVNDAAGFYKEGVIMAWEDPSNISVNGEYRPKDPKEIRTEINILKASLPDGAEIIYGGSVNRQNIGELVNIMGLSGVLVGNASLDPEHFYEICRR
jgi:triosephosphate isomerase